MSEDAIQACMDRVEKRLTSLENEVKALDGRYLSRELMEERSKGQGERIGNLELDVQSLQDDRKWLLRVVLGVIIMAVLALVVNGTEMV